MAPHKRIGFYLSDNKFYFVESSDNNLVRVVISPPFYPQEQGPSEDIRLIALIQKTIRENSISLNEVRFSIPQSEVIIRSFLIPMMKSSELNPVVDFELRKHIPFELKEFSYTFNPIQVLENKVKKFRILVAATRQALLERYEQVLNQAKLSVLVSEPAPFSLVRVLFAKKVINIQARFALIHIGENVGRIIFVHEGMVLFIREFQLNQSGDPAQTHQEEQMLKAKFINEIQNSLDFFTRAHEQIPVSQLIILKHDSERSYDAWLNDEISIPKKIIDIKTLVGSQDPADEMSVLYAYGASLADPKSPKIFNLSRKAIKKSASVSILQDIDFKEYVTTIKTSVIAVILLVILVVFFNFKSADLQRQKDHYAAQQEDLADLTTEDIQKKIEDNAAKLKQYQGIVIKNTVSDIFVTISSLLPQGLWLTSLDIRATVRNVKDGEVVVFKNGFEIAFNGVVYAEDPNKEIRIVNEFINKLKKDPTLAKYVSSISLINMLQQEMNSYKVVNISVKGS